MVEPLGSVNVNSDTRSVGFRGFAPAFQPSLTPFLDRHDAQLSGLTRVGDLETLVAHVGRSRPDYLVIWQDEIAKTDVAALAEAVRGAALPTLMVGQGGGVPDLPEGLSVEPVDPAISVPELALRLRALIRRCRPQAMQGRQTWASLELDEACMTFSVDGRPVSLSLEVFCVLGVMMDEPATEWDRADLHALVFGANSDNGIRAIDTRISRARRLVSHALGCDPIRSVRGTGYALVPDP